MAPPFVACRICRSVEGKCKNYTDNNYLIRAYEEFSGCPFEEWPYLTKFCPECACLIRKVYKFRRKCRKSYRFVVEHLESGRKITKPFIEQTGSSLYHKPTDFTSWEPWRFPTKDLVHDPKAYKSKKKPADEVFFHIKHLTVPKDPEAEISTSVPGPIYDFNHRYYDSSDLEEELYPKPRPPKKTTGVNMPEATQNTLATGIPDNYNPSVLESPNSTEEPVTVLEGPVNILDAPNLGPNILDAPNLEENVLETQLEDDLNEAGLEMKMEDDMIDNTSDDQTEVANDHKLILKAEEEDPDNLTLQEIKAEMLGVTETEKDIQKVEKGGKRKRTGKQKENQSQAVLKKSKQQVQARRRKSNQELEEHFTVTQFLTEDEQMQEFLKRREGQGYLEGTYKCELCLKSFKEQKWMDAHVKKHEPPAGSFVCTICKIRCRTPKLYRTHRDCNHTTRYACRRCNFFTYSKAQALKHHGWHEGVEHTCQHCGATFRKHTTYMGHLRRAHPSAHICGVCARSFVSAYGLNLHIKAVHKDVNKLENDSTRCEECDVMFVSRQMYVRHLLITDRHKDISKDILGCRKCGQQFETREEMERHTHYKERKYVKKDEQRRSIKCDECSEVFSHPNGVYQHYLREHPDTPYRFAVRRHYLCEQCGKTFKSPGLLQQHSLVHLGLRPPAAAAKKPPGRNCCRLCGKTYSKLSGLFRHKLTHLGVRRHKCHICEKAFTDTSNLKQHVQGVHLNIRRIRKR